MAKALTVKAVEAAKAEASRREIPDGGLPGLYLVVTPTGAKSWAVRYRHATRTRKLTIGTYPAFGLAEARKAAGEALRAVAEGRDPGVEKRLAKAERSERANLAENVLDEFITKYVERRNRPNTVAAAKAVVENRLKPAWKGRLIGSITRRDVLDLIEGIADGGHPAAANRALAVTSKFFAWCVDRDILKGSPSAGVKPPAKVESRDRVLSNEEIRLLWVACEAVGWPFGDLGKLLLLTAQRREEVAGARWEEIDLKSDPPLWTIPAARAKNGESHSVPLSRSVVAILQALPRVEPPEGAKDALSYVLSTTGQSAVSGFSRGKSAIDREMLALARKEAEERGEDPERIEIVPWRLHDLRRTAATGMAAIGIQPHVVEAILNHVSGHRAGVAGVYNRAKYQTEKVAALQAWAARVDAICGVGSADNVVAIRGVVK